MQATPPAHADRSRSLAARAPALAIAAAFVGMLAWTWGTWPDPTVDFGTQLYLAWQISLGEVLYRDLAHFKGPLSQYVNGALFRVFGVGLRTLTLFNIVVFAGVVTLIYRLLRTFTDQLGATAATVVGICVCGFIQLMDFGNYNWVCPYAHEYTHGLALSLGMIALLASAVRNMRTSTVAAAGAMCGLAFLTTAEVFAATNCAATVGMFAAMRVAQRNRRAQLLAAFIGAALLPPIVCFALLSAVMPASDALRGALGSWPWVFNREIGKLGFYREVMGLHEMGWSVRRMLIVLAGYAAIFGPLAILAFLVRRATPKAQTIIGVASAALIAFIFWRGLRWFPWFEIARPWPLFVGAVVIIAFVQLWRRPVDAPRTVRATLSVFAFVLLGKMILNVSLRHYGFVLALPATVLLVEALIGALPRAIDRAGGAGVVFRWAALAACAMATAAHLYGHHLFTRDKTVVVGRGVDTFLSNARGDEANAVLRAIEQFARPGETLAVLPQGLMFNYLTRRPHPNAYGNFMPPEVISTGEQRIVAAYDREPPDLVVLIEVVTAPDAFILPEANYRYGQAMRAWVDQNYANVALVKHSRSPHGWRLMRRRERTTSMPAPAPVR
jgi:hypothetical protein